MRVRGVVPARFILALAASLLCILLPAGCAGGADPATDESTARVQLIKRGTGNAGTALSVGSRGSTEQRILREIYAQALEAAGYEVTRSPDLKSTKLALEALRGGEVDGYPEYVSLALGSFLGVKSADVPSDPAAVLQRSREGLQKEGLLAFASTPFTAVNGVAMLQTRAKELTAPTLSALEREPKDLVLYGPPGCPDRLDCLAGLRRGYDLSIERFIPGDNASRYTVLEQGRADLSVVSRTDAELGRQPDIAILDDDKRAFPPRNVTFIAREATVREAGPDMRRTIELVQGGLTQSVVRELNARVDLDGAEPGLVAGEYLKEAGYVR